MKPVSSWGRLSADPHHVVMLNDPSSVKGLICGSRIPGLAYGMGRSYGDVCLNPEGMLWATAELDHLICFDESTGCLVCEAGVLLQDIQRLVIPRGWMLPVTPGTQLVTIGGAIANDVHGKNHHVYGSFGDHVKSLTLVRTDGDVIRSAIRRFAATVVNETGIMPSRIQLHHTGPWNMETVPYANLETFFELADDSEANWEHTVSWIDCITSRRGRGLFMRANSTHIEGGSIPRGRKLTMPFVPPISLINRASLRPFNMAYYHLTKWQARRAIAHYEPFLYPLDNLSQWKTGPKGFFQYQSVSHVKLDDAVQAMLKKLPSQRWFVPYGVKTFGNRQSVGMLSFPQPVTLALDFPQPPVGRLDAMRMRPRGDLSWGSRSSEAGYPRLAEFINIETQA